MCGCGLLWLCDWMVKGSKMAWEADGVNVWAVFIVLIDTILVIDFSSSDITDGIISYESFWIGFISCECRGGQNQSMISAGISVQPGRWYFHSCWFETTNAAIIAALKTYIHTIILIFSGIS